MTDAPHAAASTDVPDATDGCDATDSCDATDVRDERGATDAPAPPGRDRDRPAPRRPGHRYAISPAEIASASTRSGSAPSSTRRRTFVVATTTTNATATEAPANTYAALGE